MRVAGRRDKWISVKLVLQAAQEPPSFSPGSEQGGKASPLQLLCPGAGTASSAGLCRAWSQDRGFWPHSQPGDTGVPHSMPLNVPAVLKGGLMLRLSCSGPLLCCLPLLGGRFLISAQRQVFVKYPVLGVCVGIKLTFPRRKNPCHEKMRGAVHEPSEPSWRP